LGCEITPIQRLQWLDQEDAWVQDMIRNHDWAIKAVFAEPERRMPSFAYTIGLTELGHPELLAFGLTESSAGALLNALGDRVRAGGIIPSSVLIPPGDVCPYELAIFDVPNPSEILFAAASRYGPMLEARQIVVADPAGYFPWDPAYSYPSWLQPMPGTFAA